MTAGASPLGAAARYAAKTFVAMLVIGPVAVMLAASLKDGAFAVVRASGCPRARRSCR